MSKVKIAIDGPSGAGKSTIAKALAKTLGYIYVDTGAMYRSVALYCIEHGVAPSDEKNVEPLLEGIDINIVYENNTQQIYLCGKNVSELIRTPEVSMGASDVSRHGKVREKLVSLQREIAKKQDVIMDGRDIATKVLPDADVAIFLTADVNARAKRRFDELIEKGQSVSYEEVLEDMLLRDKNDSTRANSPLKQAEKAILVDTTGCNLDEAINTIHNIIISHLENRNV